MSRPYEHDGDDKASPSSPEGCAPLAPISFGLSEFMLEGRALSRPYEHDGDDKASPSSPEGCARLAPISFGLSEFILEGRALSRLYEHDGDDKASPSSAVILSSKPLQFIHLPLIWPLLCRFDQTLAYGVLTHVLPLLFIALTRAKLRIPK